MINVTVYKTADGFYKGFECVGHADFANKGKDIVCAAVSVLVINTINSIENFVSDLTETRQNEESGMISFYHIEDIITSDFDLLMKSLILGLQEIQKNYGKYITLIFKEV